MQIPLESSYDAFMSLIEELADLLMGQMKFDQNDVITPQGSD